MSESFDNLNQEEDARGFGYKGVVLDSISLFLDEPPLLQGSHLGGLLNLEQTHYEPYTVPKAEEFLAPRTWNLPEIFRKKLTAFSQHSSHEVNRQNRLAELVRYNFSNGYQIGANEILRHPLFRKVPPNLLPDGKAAPSVFNKWPLLQKTDKSFVSQALLELEGIMQALLEQIAQALTRKEVKVFAQSKNHLSKALELSSIEFDATQEMDWRVEFFERKNELESEIKLVTFRNKALHFFESFAIEPETGTIIVHPWMIELSLFQQTLSEQSLDLRLLGPQPHVQLNGEIEVKSVLKHLRSRNIPVKIEGESRTLSADQSQIQIHISESGQFFIRHDARVLVRQGFTSKSALFLQTLSKGLPFLLGIEPKEMAARMGNKRDWDLRLLKNLGLLQYVFVEVLSFHFDGALLDGREVEREDFFASIQPNIRDLLVAGGGSSFVKDLPLTELCSKPVVSCVENFINISFKALRSSESFYSETGEVILEGVVEREFRLIYQILQSFALSTNGEVFKRARSSLLSKIAVGDTDEDLQLKTVLLRFPGASTAGQALEQIQNLIPHGFKIFYKDQPLQELQEDEFHVDFVLKTDADPQFFNWFELNPKFFLRGEQVDPDRFLSLGSGGVIEYEGKLFLVPQKQLPSLKRLEKFWEKLQKGKTESSRRKNGDKIYQLPRHQTLELLALRASGVGIRGDEEWKKLCDFYDDLGKEQNAFPIPSTTHADLKPYQVAGVKWLHDLYRLKLGALLADDMGLGKTLQTLTFLDSLREKGELGQVLIVVPSSLVFNWQSESEKFTPSLSMSVFTNRDYDTIGRRLESREQMVVITTYGLLMEHEEFLTQYKWKVLIFDEAQNLKNITTKRTSAARALTAQFKIGLTGTPMENHYGEFYSLVDLLVPGSLGKIEDFRRQFVNTDLVTREELEDLKLKIKPLLLRRTKKEILDQLPEKQETKISIAFEEKQKEIYRDIALSYNQRVQEAIAVQGEASVQLQMLTALLRLRQACSDPAALPNVKYEKVPPKLETLRDSLKEIVESGESALVFTQFLQTLQHSVELLRKDGIPVFALHGGVPSAQRQKILSEFNKVSGGAVLVMTLKTGGVGLNLTKASYVFHLEPWWNPSVENQATDRVHRMGQGRAVQVFRYIMHESLEEKMELLKSRKDRKFQTLLTNSEDFSTLEKGSGALSKQDFDLLLGLK